MKPKQSFYTLGIETSCDDTAAAVYHRQKGILSNIIFSQVVHQQYGGVVPELASRGHLQKIKEIVQRALDTAQVTLNDIQVVAITNRPGLPGSLLVGLCFGKAMAWASNKKIIGINHLEGHAFSSFLENSVPFPHLCLTASGGHTSLYLIEDFGNYRVLGQTADDAAGEAFDKIGKLMGIPYPAGAQMEKYAALVNFQDYFHYPRATSNSINFSFSGLKTAVLYDMVKQGAYDLSSKTFLKKDDSEFIYKVCSSLLVAIKDIFIDKIELAYKLHPEIKAVTFVGGVACNKFIKQAFTQWCTSRNLQFYSPSSQYCTDNAAMIAFVGNYKALNNEFSEWDLDILK